MLPFMAKAMQQQETLANDCRREREVVCKHDYGRNLLIKKALTACRALFFFPLKIAGGEEQKKGKKW